LVTLATAQATASSRPRHADWNKSQPHAVVAAAGAKVGRSSTASLALLATRANSATHNASPSAAVAQVTRSTCGTNVNLRNLDEVKMKISFAFPQNAKKEEH